MDAGKNEVYDADLPPLYVEYPSLFFSEFTGRPFQQCLVCRDRMRDSERPFLINKKFVGDEAVIEYALCASCHVEMSEQISSDSMHRIRDFFEKRVRMEVRARNLLLRAQGSPEQALDLWLGSCCVCSMPRRHMKRFTAIGHFEGASMVCMHYPMIICHLCELDLSRRTSKRTREFFDKFVGEHFDCPPSLEKPMPSDPALKI